MEIRPIHSDRDYVEALQLVSDLVDADPAPGTPDGDRFEILATLVERYEAEHFPLNLSCLQRARVVAMLSNITLHREPR